MDDFFNIIYQFINKPFTLFYASFIDNITYFNIPRYKPSDKVIKPDFREMLKTKANC